MCCEAVIEMVGLDLPPGPLGPAHLHLEADPRSAAVARAFVREVAGPVGPGTEEVLLLLTSELVSNAVLHGRSPPVLGVHRCGAQILVSVADTSAQQPRPQAFSDSRGSGRGMALVEALADRWGSMTCDGGKSVWFLVRDDDTRGD